MIDGVRAFSLPAPAPAAIVERVHLLRFLFLLASIASLCGCATRYTCLRVTNIRGQTLSEWVARGRIHRAEGGYDIEAVERVSGRPYRIRSKYPDGWKARVIGPHIAHWPCEEPEWLAERD